MSNEPSLLNRINSKYILKSILSLAYSDMKSVLKFVEHNKNLLKMLDIDMKDYYQYNYKTKIIKNGFLISLIKLSADIINFILFLIYSIMFWVKGALNEKNLKEGYNLKKKIFVDFMDQYILLAYLGYLVLISLLIIFLFIRNIYALKGYIKRIIFYFIFLIDLTHYILYIIKYIYSMDLIIEQNEIDSKEYDKLIWFVIFDYYLVFFLSLNMFICIFGLFAIYTRKVKLNDIKIFFINQIYGINICDFELPEEYAELNEKNKNIMIFQKENMEDYNYKLNDNQIKLIKKINDIRKENKISELKYEEEGQLPDFITNKKTQLILFPYENKYKISSNLYIFKYPKNEFQNHLNEKEILNIIAIDILDKINILEQKETEIISIYNINANKNNNFIRQNNSNRIELSPINIPSTEDELKN